MAVLQLWNIKIDIKELLVKDEERLGKERRAFDLAPD